jgi:hypothetical protein
MNGMRRCRHCGTQFKPYHSGDFYCCETKECADEQAEDANEAEARRREAAEADDYARY